MKAPYSSFAECLFFAVVSCGDSNEEQLVDRKIFVIEITALEDVWMSRSQRKVNEIDGGKVGDASGEGRVGLLENVMRDGWMRIWRHVWKPPRPPAGKTPPFPPAIAQRGTRILGIVSQPSSWQVSEYLLE